MSPGDSASVKTVIHCIGGKLFDNQTNLMYSEIHGDVQQLFRGSATTACALSAFMSRIFARPFFPLGAAWRRDRRDWALSLSEPDPTILPTKHRSRILHKSDDRISTVKREVDAAW